MPGRQAELFDDTRPPDGVVAVNGQCVVRADAGHRVVLVNGVPVAQYAVGDRMAEAHAMVFLVEQGWAEQVEVARAFGATTRTVRRYQRRFEDGGLTALGRRSGFPAGKPRVAKRRLDFVAGLHADGQSNRAIAHRVGVSEKAIRKLLTRLGCRRPSAEQQRLPLPGDPEVPALAARPEEKAVEAEPAPADPNLSAPAPAPEEKVAKAEPAPADPNLSAPVLPPVAAPEGRAAPDPTVVPVSADPDPADRRFDRLLAYLGLLDDAAPLFRDGQHVPAAGVLLAIPALLKSGLLDEARAIYGSIGPAFYGLRTTLVALVIMALLRIKRPEGLKEHSPTDLGRILGLDRAPEVKTLRRKLARLAAASRATELGRRLAARRVADRGDAMGFLYVDGHVRVYHGARTIPQTHVARMRLAMPATTDYWINDATGEPLFVVTAEANAGLAQVLPSLLATVRGLVKERRVTVVFDRGGWSPKLFLTLIASGFDILTYRKGKTRPLPKSRFTEHTATFDGKEVSYQLAEQNVLLLGGTLRLRQVVRLSQNGKHQTQIVTSRRDLPAIEVAYRMFERWRQENFFKYLREEYALDALSDYAVEPDDPDREVPNPKWASADARWQAANARVTELTGRVGIDATLAALGRGRAGLDPAFRNELADAVAKAMKLRDRRDAIPRRIPVGARSNEPVIKLATERKHLTNVLKMVAYQLECDLARALAPHYRRHEDEGRTLVQAALAAPADLCVDGDVLYVTLSPLAFPHWSVAISAVCAELNAAMACFPGTRLLLHYAVAGVGPERTH